MFPLDIFLNIKELLVLINLLVYQKISTKGLFLLVIYLSFLSSMFKYNILSEEVKSDFAFEVNADNLSELFRGAGIAMMEAMVSVKEFKAKRVWEFKIESDTPELLLYDFLGELVFVKDVESVLFKDYEIKIEENDKFKLSCKAFGDDIDYEKYEILTDVKAVTMHNFVLEKRNDEWYCHIIVDL